jgi:hypothetical protein
MYNIIVKVKDATPRWAGRPNVHRDEACRGFHGSIVHPGSLHMPRGAWY